MSYNDTFYNTLEEHLQMLRNSQADGIRKAAEMFFDCMTNNGIVQLTGLGHCEAFAMELGYRAGGLMPFHKCTAIDLALRGKLTRAEVKNPDFDCHPEYASIWLGLYNIQPTDLFLLSSYDGSEPLMVELAKEVRKNGHKVIAVVCRKAVPAKADNIVNYADLVLDTCADCPDLAVSVGTAKASQLNSILGNVMAQMITAETYRYFEEQGVDCPVLLSVNVSGADVHNRKLSDVYVGRWNS